RRELHERRRHEDAVRQCALRLTEHVDQLDVVAIPQVEPAQRGQVGDRLRGVLRVARDVEAELEPLGAPAHGVPPAAATSAPRSSSIRVRPCDSSPLWISVVRASSAFSTCLACSSTCSDFTRTPSSASSASSRTRLSLPATSVTSVATRSAPSFSQRSVPISTSPPAL